MKILIDDFKGIAPKIPSDLLAEGFAQSAVNVRLERGLLESFKGLAPAAVSVPSTARSLFHYMDGYWFSSTDPDVTFADAQKISDPFHYAVIADTLFPKITRYQLAIASSPYPASAFRLGVIQPQIPLSATPQLREGSETWEADPEVDIPTFTSYRYSIVDGFDREGALSPPSPLISFYPKNQFNALVIPAVSAPASYYMTGAKVRIYRVNPSDGGGYQFVMEVPYSVIAGATASDMLADDMLGLPPETEDWYEPPDENTELNPGGPLRNLTPMPGGFFLGSSGDELCASVIDAPHAWPYRQSIGEKIQGIAVMGNAAVVATTGAPFVVQGVDPSAMQPTKLNSNQACISPRSVVSIGDAVIYASPDGLVAVSGYDAKVITSPIISKEEWQRDFDPTQIHAYYYEGKYIFFNNTKGYVLRVDGGLALTELGFTASAGYSDLAEDKLYLMVGGTLRVFEGSASRMTYNWRSKVYRFDWPTSMACIRVNAMAYPVSLNLHCRKPNGLMKIVPVTVSKNETKMLPAGFSYTELFIEIVSDQTVKTITLATDKSEIMEFSNG
jgi:hypothetical protein